MNDQATLIENDQDNLIGCAHETEQDQLEIRTLPCETLGLVGGGSGIVLL